MNLKRQIIKYGNTIQNFTLLNLVSNSKFAIKNPRAVFAKSSFQYLNLRIKILKNVKAKLAASVFVKFWRFAHILDDGTDFRKYASFERVEIVGIPWFYRHLSTKKALTKSAFSENSSSRKGANLMQNVKNQFFHQLSWRGIWVVKPLTFGINLA